MKQEPKQLEYINAMLPGIINGAFWYWLSLFAIVFLVTFSIGTLNWSLAAVAAVGLVAYPIALFIAATYVRLLLCLVNLSLGKPVGCSNLAVCVSGFTHYLLTAWIPLLYLLYKPDGIMFLLTSLLGPFLAMTCGSVAVRLFERRQHTFVPYPRPQFQFRLKHFFTLTIAAAISLACMKSLTNYRWIVIPVGYCLLQTTLVLLLSLLPPVKNSDPLKSDNEEMLDVADPQQ